VSNEYTVFAKKPFGRRRINAPFPFLASDINQRECIMLENYNASRNKLTGGPSGMKQSHGGAAIESIPFNSSAQHPTLMRG
jgi:hypothetical protein